MLAEADGHLEPPDENDWLLIPEWDKFQHYKNRNPPWIKLYTKLLSNPQFLKLTLWERGLLMTLWIIFASTSGQARYKDVARLSQARFGTPTLIALNHAGFIMWTKDKPASNPHSPSTEVEKEKETPSPLTGKTPSQELLLRALDVAADWNGGSSEDFDSTIDELQKEFHMELPKPQREALWDEALKRNRFSW